MNDKTLIQNEHWIDQCFQLADWYFRYAWYGNMWPKVREQMSHGDKIEALYESVRHGLRQMQKHPGPGCLSADAVLTILQTVRRKQLGQCRPMPLVGGLTIVPYPAADLTSSTVKEVATITVVVCTWVFQHWRLWLLRGVTSIRMLDSFITYPMDSRVYILIPWSHIPAALFTLRADLVYRTLDNLKRHGLDPFMTNSIAVPVFSHCSWQDGYLNWRVLMLILFAAKASVVLGEKTADLPLLTARQHIARISYPVSLHHRGLSLLYSGYVHPVLPSSFLWGTLRSIPPYVNLSVFKPEIAAGCLLVLSDDRKTAGQHDSEMNRRLMKSYNITPEYLHRWGELYIRSDAQTATSMADLMNM